MTDSIDAVNTAALAALATAVGDNDDDPVTIDGFIEAMWPATVGAGMTERTAARTQGHHILRRLVLTEDVTAETIDIPGSPDDARYQVYSVT